jgi:hypothetical protein
MEDCIGAPYQPREGKERERFQKKVSAFSCPPCTTFSTSFFNFQDDLHQLYPDLFEVITIVAALPVTVASRARTHSKVKIINNNLRAAVSPIGPIDSRILSSERDQSNNIELSKLVEIFNLVKPHQLFL